MQCGQDPMNDLFGTYQCPRKMCSIYSNACSDLKISITNADTGTGTCMVLRSMGLGASLLDESPLYTQTASWWVRVDSRSQYATKYFRHSLTFKKN